MQIERRHAVGAGIAAIVAVVLLQTFNSVACYELDFGDSLGAFAIFVLPPLIPAVAALFALNPLRAVTAAAFFAPWLVFAYITDCGMPYRGGGASMFYVVVLIFGLPCAIVGALLGDLITRGLGFHVHAG